MVANLQGFKGIKNFAKSQEDAAEFSVGTDDAEILWYAEQPVKGKNTISATGWYLQKSKNADLETAIVAYNKDHTDNPFRLVTIVHPQSKKESEDWIFPEGLSFFVLCKGVKEPWIDKAIVNCYALKWGAKNDKERESRFYVRAIIAELLAYGYDKPVQLQASKKGRTKGLIRTLVDQQRALAEFRKQYDMALPFWGFSLPIGADVMDVGNADVSKEMYVPVSLIPSKITEEYLQAHYVGNYPYKPDEGDDALNLMLSATFKEGIEWARDTTKALLKGKVQPEEGSDAPENDESSESPEFGSYGDSEPPHETERPTIATKGNGGIATDGQRSGLKRLGVTSVPTPSGQHKDVDDPNLTYAEAVNAIMYAQKDRGK